MPALHIFGEIVGASGLRPRDAFSLAHWLDLLSLHPSSKQGFFCRWRLRIRGLPSSSSPTSKLASLKSHEWQVLQGASRGQTQVQAWSPITPTHERITKSNQRRPARAAGEDQDPQANDDDEASLSLLELDTLWCHPIDLHLAMATTTSLLPASWPYLECQVWRLDEFHHEHLVGTSSLAVPLTQQEYFLDLPIITSTSSDGEPNDDDETQADDNGETMVTTSSAGTLYLRFAVVQLGFEQQGIVC